MEAKQLRQTILNELPILMQNNTGFRDAVLQITRVQFADKVETESRFDSMMKLLERKMASDSQMWQESEQRWKENDRRWKENEQRWEELHQEIVAITNVIQKNERRWEENERRWEELHQEIVAITNAIQENERRWEESQQESKRRWEENHKEMVAITNAIQENERRWEENERRWEESQQESKRRWEENERRWEESQQESKRRWDKNHQEIVAITNAIQENEQRWKESQQESKRLWEENRQESKRLWEESQQESKRLWEENQQESKRRWEENHKEMVALTNAIQEQNKKIDRKYDQTVGALGSRWGLHSEAAFRNALAGILKDFQGIEVINVNEYDDEGIVFGHPDQIELDIIVKNSVLIICEIKSSINKSDMYAFERKVRFYEQKHARKASRLIVISPMVDRYAGPVADKLGIEVYSYAEDVDL